MDVGTFSDTLVEHPRRPSLDDASTKQPRDPPQDAAAAASAAAAGNLEPDTCRICRGEATPQEPLFYPCKCSGSIKYVHQDCLMEWLSHSQKKHCELCKTSFRFTKLYSPTMPKQLPAFVFARHLAKYFVRNILVWLRVVLVFFIWMVFLPILTRWEWSFFFWVSEEGLVAPHKVAAAAAAAAAATANTSSSSLPESLATAAASVATSAAHGILNGAQAQAHIQSQAQLDPFGLLDANRTAPYSFFSVAIRVLLDSFGTPDIMSLLTSTNGTQGSVVASIGPPTLLSEVAFLRNLTRFRVLNRIIIYAIEGQFITFLVIICFILIILVRDYVVQQQPEINMRAAFAAAEEEGANANDGGAGVPGVQVAGQPPGGQPNGGRHHNHHHHHGDDPDAGFDHWAHELDDSDWETDSNSDIENAELQLPLAPDHGVDVLHFGHVHDHDHDHGPPVPDTDRSETGSIRNLGSPPSPTRASSPTLETTPGSRSGRLNSGSSRDETGGSSSSANTPDRRAVPNFDRNFPLPSEGGATVHEYMRIYRRAGGDPQRILEIAREENLEEHLQYWLRVMQNVAERRQSDRGSTASTVSTATAEAAESQDEAAGDDATPLDESSRSADNRRQHWYDLDQRSGNFLASRANSKGKRRADEPREERREGEEEGNEAGDEADSTEPSQTTSFSEFEYGLRPRANTDGPSGPPRTNRLGNNNWSFAPTAPVPPPMPIETMTGFPAQSDAFRHHIQNSTQQPVQPVEPEPRMQGQLRRRTKSAKDPQEQPTLNRDGTASSSGMANIAEEADDSSAPVNAPADSSTDASAAVPTPPTTHSSLENVANGENNLDATQINVEAAAADTADAPDAAANAPANDEPNRHNDAPPQHGPTAGAAAGAATDGFLDDLANFMWRDLDNIDPADLPPIPAEQDDDVHVALFNQDDAPLPMDEQDREAFEAAAAAAAAANMEAEAIEDAEDLEGVMELLGMRGPITGLFQNVIFCGFLVTVSLLLGIFMPYNVGRLSIWLLANPMRPVMMLFSLSKLLQDAAAAVLGGIAFATLYVLHGITDLVEQAVGWAIPAAYYLMPSLATTWDLCTTSATRVVDNFKMDPPFLSTGEIRNFSAISHEALIHLKGHFGIMTAAVGRAFIMVATGEFLTRGVEALDLAKSGGAAAWALLRALPAVLSNPGSWVITLDSLDPIQVNPAFAYWDSGDRSLAILMGYATMCLVAGLYLHRGSPFSNGATAQEWEASLIDGLNQASGVLKVILIIGIEMLVFPLYCGLLLDVALLPLFEDTTLKSRLYFSIHYPLTSIFVHWFVGTGYMFHFALFVSMCRKIMRKGVLYFIRDPDDPEFHPVRDVLERSVTTQLRKILFSAFVYGALVIICLGGVVWGLAYAGPGVLPIHYSSNEPVLEFPIDLLFYNFLMPLAIKFFKPSDGLHAMYTWWFRKSARILRITWFLFGERRIDEEGVLALPRLSPYLRFPWLSRQFLDYDEAHHEVVPKGLKTADFPGFDNNGRAGMMSPDGLRFYSTRKRMLIASGGLIPDGRFVRAPASDQVKIPKGKTVFLDVNDAGVLREALQDYVSSHSAPAGPGAFINVNDNDNVNGNVNGNGNDIADGNGNRDGNVVDDDIGVGHGDGGVSETDLYHGNQYQLVYIPPHFRARVFLFIAFIWLFAAVTGVSFTIIPLLFGRRLFQVLLPVGVRTNDIYAFSIGIYVLGSAAYFVFHMRAVVRALSGALRRTFSAASALSAVQTTARVVRRAAQLAYAYFFILVVFPLLATALVELYVLIPLHTYMYPPEAPRSSTSDDARHTVRIIQSWTLGLLYLKVSARTITSWYPEARLSSAIRAVLRRGNLDPDVRLLTRAFVVPGMVLAAAAIGLPLLLARGLVASATSSSGTVTTTASALLQFLQLMLPANTNISAAAAATAADAFNKTSAGGLLPTAADAAADLRLVYRLSFPFVALVGMAGWSLWGMVGVYASWKVRIRDEAYLIGERLHNFGVTNMPPSAARRAFRAGVGRP